MRLDAAFASAVACSSLFTMLVARTAEAAADVPCSSVHVESDEGLGDEWAPALRDVKNELARLTQDECRRVTLWISATKGAARVVAVDDEGNRTERDIPHASALVPTVLGLVLSMPESRASDVPPPPRLFLPSPATEALPPRAPLRPAAAVVVQTPIAAWVGFALGGRVAEPTSAAMVDVEGRTDVLFGRWLLFASFRYAPAGTILGVPFDADAYHETAVGLGVGRRLAIGATFLDGGIMPTLIASRMEGDRNADRSEDDVKESEVQLRFDASVRWMVPLDTGWGLTLTVDGDFAPTDLGAPIRLDPILPPFPTWTAGVRLGMSWALR